MLGLSISGSTRQIEIECAPEGICVCRVDGAAAVGDSMDGWEGQCGLRSCEGEGESEVRMQLENERKCMFETRLFGFAYNTNSSRAS